MGFLAATLLVTVTLLGLEWLFRLQLLGRRVLGAMVLAWALMDAIHSAQENPDHAAFTFAWSLLASTTPLGLWWWASSRIRDVVAGRGPKPRLHRDALLLSAGKREAIRPDVPPPPTGEEKCAPDLQEPVSSDGVEEPLLEIGDEAAEADWTFPSPANLDAASGTVVPSASWPWQNMVLIAAGSPGSGKTATLSSASDPAVGLTIEETMDNLDEARSLVDRILASGRRPIILWLYVDDPAKTVDRMLARAHKIGRVETMEQMAKSYHSVPQVLAALKSEFGHRIRVHVADNSGVRGEQRFIADEDRGWGALEDAIATRVGLAQVDATNRMFRDNPNFEVPY